MGTPLRVGLIGAGGISGAHLRAYQEFSDWVQVTAVADPREEAAQRRAEQLGSPPVYTDPERMTREAPIDAVDICTPHNTHAPLAIAAAEAGKHVLVEKPMACSMEECRQMVAAAEKNGVTLMVAQCLRYEPKHRAAKKAIEAGELGALYAAEFQVMQNLRAIRPPGDWLFDGKIAGGGALISISVHLIDLMRYFIGDIRRVAGECRTFLPEFHNGAEDYAAATLEFENGAIGSHFTTYSGYRMPWGIKFLILGEHGALFNTAIASEARSGDGPREFVELEPDYEGLATDDGFTNEILHWVECCRSGQEPLTSGRDNLNTMAAIFGIYESNRRGGAPVDLATL